MNTEKIQQQIRYIQDYITHYNDGLLTSHEMANRILLKVDDITDLPDQGCDGLPPNDILPDGTKA